MGSKNTTFWIGSLEYVYSVANGVISLDEYHNPVDGEGPVFLDAYRGEMVDLDTNPRIVWGDPRPSWEVQRRIREKVLT